VKIPPPSKFDRAAAKALAKVYLYAVEKGEDPEVIEDLRRAVLNIWEIAYEYFKDDEVFQDLVNRNLIPPEPPRD